MRRGAAKVALGAVPIDGDVQTPHGGLGIVLAVDLEGVDEAVGGVVGLVEVLGLDVGGLLEGLASFDVCGSVRVSPDM